MKAYELTNKKGFEVIHNSTPWRVAVHASQPEVNGVPSFHQWGRHMESEEGFVLLTGQGWLVTSSDGRDYHIQELKNEELTLVEQAERHAILLAENSSALIVENLDMSNSVNEEMDPAMKEEILKKIGF